MTNEDVLGIIESSLNEIDRKISEGNVNARYLKESVMKNVLLAVNYPNVEEISFATEEVETESEVEIEEPLLEGK